MHAVYVFCIVLAAIITVQIYNKAVSKSDPPLRVDYIVI